MRLLERWLRPMRERWDRLRRERGVRVGLTVGLDRIVAVELRGGLTGPRVAQVHARTLAPPSEDGSWPDLTDALHELSEALGARIAAASVALLRPIARTKVLSVPMLSRRDVRALLTRNVRRYFVVGPEPVQADAQRLRRGKRGDTVPALAVCGDRRRIEIIERCFAAAGVTVVGMTAAPLALTEAVSRRVAAARKGGAVIAVDAPGWSEGIAVCRGKPKALQPWTDPGAGNFEELVKELRGCIDGGADPDSGDVAGIVLASGDRRERIRQAVAAATGGDTVDWADLDRHQPEAVAALGAALVGEDAPMLVTDATRRVRERRIRSRLAALSAAAVILLAVSAGLYRLDLGRELEQIAVARQGMAEDVAAALELRRSVDAVRERLRVIADAEQAAIGWTPALAALAQALPDSAYLLSMTTDGIELRLAGLASTASSIVPALEASPLLSNVSLTVARRAEGTMDAERFDVALYLDPESTRRPPLRPEGGNR